MGVEQLTPEKISPEEYFNMLIQDPKCFEGFDTMEIPTGNLISNVFTGHKMVPEVKTVISKEWWFKFAREYSKL